MEVQLETWFTGCFKMIKAFDKDAMRSVQKVVSNAPAASVGTTGVPDRLGSPPHGVLDRELWGSGRSRPGDLGFIRNLFGSFGTEPIWNPGGTNHRGRGISQDQS